MGGFLLRILAEIESVSWNGFPLQVESARRLGLLKRFAASTLENFQREYTAGETCSP